MLYAILLIGISTIAIASDGSQVAGQAPEMFAGMLLSALSDKAKKGDPVVVRDNDNQLRLFKFVAKFGDGDMAEVAVVNENGHGFLYDAKNVQSVNVEKK